MMQSIANKWYFPISVFLANLATQAAVWIGIMENPAIDNVARAYYYAFIAGLVAACTAILSILLFALRWRTRPIKVWVAGLIFCAVTSPISLVFALPSISNNLLSVYLDNVYGAHIGAFLAGITTDLALAFILGAVIARFATRINVGAAIGLAFVPVWLYLVQIPIYLMRASVFQSVDSLLHPAHSVPHRLAAIRAVLKSDLVTDRPCALVVDKRGNLYVASDSPSLIVVISGSITDHPRRVGVIAGARNGSCGLSIDPGDDLVTADYSANSITFYKTREPGEPTLSRRIAGANTRLSGPAKIAFDGKGRLYVLNSPTPSILVFDPGANGNASPTRIITGDATLLEDSSSFAVTNDGYIYVSNNAYSDWNPTVRGYISVFSPGSNGNVAPVRVLRGARTTLSYHQNFALDSEHRIYAQVDAGVAYFDSSASGDVSPLGVITLPATGLENITDFKIDASRNIYISDLQNAKVTVFQ